MKTLMDFYKSLIGKTAEDADLRETLGRWLNGRMLEISLDEVLFEFEVRQDMTNPLKVMHGGVHSAILDDLIGLLVTVQEKEFMFLSVNLTVDFIGRAMLGETVTGRARITKRGRTIINAEAEIRNVKNQLLSRATSNLVSMNQVVEIFEEERQAMV